MPSWSRATASALLLGGLAACSSPPEIVLGRPCDGSDLRYCDAATEACQAALYGFVACVLEREEGPRPPVKTATTPRPSWSAPAWARALGEDALALAGLTDTSSRSNPSPPPADFFVDHRADRREIWVHSPPADWDEPAFVGAIVRAYVRALQEHAGSSYQTAWDDPDHDRSLAAATLLSGEASFGAELVDLAIARLTLWQVGGPGLDLEALPSDLRNVYPMIAPAGHAFVRNQWLAGQTAAVRRAIDSPPALATILNGAIAAPPIREQRVELPEATLAVPAGFERAGSATLGELFLRILLARFDPGGAHLSFRDSRRLLRDRFWVARRADPRAVCFVWAFELPSPAPSHADALAVVCGGGDGPNRRCASDDQRLVLSECSGAGPLDDWAAVPGAVLAALAAGD